MPETTHIALEELFEPIRGQSRYTRAYGEAHAGAYPVYSASLAGPLTHIDTFDLDGEFLTFTVNGYAGIVQIKVGRFAINGDRAALKAKDGVTLPNLHYLAHVIEPTIRPLAVGRIVDGKNEYTKVQWAKIKDATIPILVTPDGAWDFEAMREVGERIRRAEELQAELAERAAQIQNSAVLVVCEEPFQLVSLGDEDLFRLSIGKRVLIADTADAGIPVYSANTRGTFGLGFVPHEVLEDVTHDSLIWGIDEDLNWNWIPGGEQFVPTDHCGRAEVLSEELDPEYLLYELRATAQEHGFDRVYRANLENIKGVTVRVPTDGDGHFDLARQRRLAERYRTIEDLQRGVLESLDLVVSPRLVLA